MALCHTLELHRDHGLGCLRSRDNGEQSGQDSGD